MQSTLENALTKLSKHPNGLYTYSVWEKPNAAFLSEKELVTLLEKCQNNKEEFLLA